MNFQIQCDELKKVLNTVIGTIPKNTPMAVMENFLFEVNPKNVVESELTITGSDLEIITRSKVDVEAEDKFGFLVAANLFSSLIAQLEGKQKLFFTLKENKKLEIRSKEGKYNLSTLDVKEYPESPSPTKGREIRINGKSLKEALQFVDYACDIKETIRPAMTGICFEHDESGKMNLAATDSRKLAKFITEKEIEKDVSFIIPKKASDILLNILPEEEITINYNNSYLQIEFDNTIFLTRLISQKFPNYRDILPTENQIIVTMDKKELLDTVKNLKKLTTLFGKMIFAFKKDEVTISVISEDANKQKVKLDCKGSAEIEIAFNPGYLIDILSSIKESEVKFEMSTPTKAVLINSNDYTLNLVMPVRVE